LNKSGREARGKSRATRKSWKIPRNPIQESTVWLMTDGDRRGGRGRKKSTNGKPSMDPSSEGKNLRYLTDFNAGCGVERKSKKKKPNGPREFCGSCRHPISNKMDKLNKLGEKSRYSGPPEEKFIHKPKNQGSGVNIKKLGEVLVRLANDFVYYFTPTAPALGGGTRPNSETQGTAKSGGEKGRKESAQKEEGPGRVAESPEPYCLLGS